MELRDSLRMLRSEVGLTQIEFAAAINVGYSAASRWENQNTRPNRASSAAILALAKQRSVSPVCLDALTEVLLASRADDKADKERTAQIAERLKLEERILLTGDRMRTMLDNLDLGVIGHRIFASSPKESTIIYNNRKYAEIFGYSAEEFEEKSKENKYFSIPDESRKAFRNLVKRLLAGDIQVKDFSQVIRAFRKDGSVIWLEIKGISLERFSYGWDFFVSCRDVSPRIEAERKYAEEIAVRDASLQDLYASMHFGLVSNTVFRQRDIEKVTGKALSGQDADGILALMAEGIFADNRKAFLDKFNRAYLTQAFAEKNTFDNLTCFDTACGRWLRFVYILIENPYTHHPEAVIYVYDVHAQTVATKLMHIIGDRNFDYIGAINNRSETFESFYYSPTTYQYTVEGERDYRETCAEKLLAYTPEHARETQGNAISLATIRRMLDQSEFYTTQLLLTDYDKTSFTAKVTYRYLDETKTTIVMAQHNKNRYVESFLSNKSEG